MRALLLSLTFALVALGAPAARAAEPVTSFALVVGSNRPGPGQDALVFAEDDAREVADTLRELGGYDPARVEVVLAPRAGQLIAAIERLERAVAAEHAAGRQTRVFFYYSGHARASGLSLGDDELPLDALRARLFATRASLTVIVLDACQSGAFSRVKGAEPAADFSYNSRARLDASGVAVLASSTASELSQESDFLRSSYFTHHFLVGLRGAADDNHDGRVSLDEAYRYTYHQTLVATAATAVGSQHVSVEVDLKGAGEVPLSYPEKASATIGLPADAEGQVLVVRAKAHAVVAELTKSRGRAVRVAVAPGSYQVVLRTDERILRCAVVAGPGGGEVALDACTRERPVASGTKGGGWRGPRWLAAVTVGGGAARQDAYTDRLRDFGYTNHLGGGAQLAGELLYRLHPHVAIGGTVGLVGGDRWRRSTTLEPLTIEWTTAQLAGLGRLDARAGRWTGFVQLGAGLAVTGDQFTDETGARSGDTHLGPLALGAVGVDWLPWTNLGFTWRLHASYAPSLPNLIGDRHDTGTFGAAFGLAYHR